MADSPVTVVDASAVAAVLFNEPGSDEIADRLGRRRLVATSLLLYEVANVCVKKIARYPAQETALFEAFSLLGAMGIELVAVSFDGVVALAARVGLTAYDGSYLWLARQLRAELVTMDKALESAWRSL